MSLEQALDANTAAIKDLTAAITAGGKTTAASTPAATGGKPPKAAKPKITTEALITLAKETRTKIGPDAYKTLLKEQTGVDALKDVPPEKMDSFAAALIEARDAEPAETGGDDDDV
jgi:hypothetical protein